MRPDDLDPPVKKIDLQKQFADARIAAEKSAEQKAGIKRPRAAFQDSAAGFSVGGLNNNGAGFIAPASSIGSGVKQRFGLHPSWLLSQGHMKKHEHEINHELDKIIKAALRNNWREITIHRGVINKKGDPLATQLLQRRLETLLNAPGGLDKRRMRLLGRSAGLNEEQTRARLQQMTAKPGKSKKEIRAEQKAAQKPPPAAAQPAKPAAP